jgi:uncharacterized protein DUF3987
MYPTERILSALREFGCEPKKSGKEWTCRCPAHEDRNPSLSIGTGDDGRALVKCHASCSAEAVCHAIGLELRDLMPENTNGATVQPKTRRGVPVPKTSSNGVTSGGFGDGDGGGDDKRVFPSAQKAVSELERSHGKRSEWWTYHDAESERVMLVVRFDAEVSQGNSECKPGKTFRPVARVKDGWIIGDPLGPIPLYDLPALFTAPPETPVVVCEGEKAADAAKACGLLSTTSAHGAQAAAKTDWSPVRGRVVWVLPDHDKAGEKYAEDVVRLAFAAGARSVRIVRLANHWPDLPRGGDMADVLELAKGDQDTVRGAVEALAKEIEPEDAPIPTGPARFVPFPVDVLPEPIRSFVVRGSKALCCDSSFIALPMLSGLASAIGNTHRIQLKRSWTEPAIVWTAIVGESGTVKSPALELALGAVRKRQHRAMKEHAERVMAWEIEHARWEIENSNWKRNAAKADSIEDPPEAPEKPTCPRTWTDDTTVEALVTKLQENPRGLLMIRDELSGWFNFDRYNGSKGGGDAAKWLEVFGGRSLIVDRKSSGTEYVPRASVSIAGGIQPETLKRALAKEHLDNGLAARLLFAMPPRIPKRWTEEDIDEGTVAAVEGVFDRLYDLEPAINAEGDSKPRLVTLNDAAKRAWVRFVNEHGVEQAERVGEEAAAWSKLEGYAARFALVIHLARVAASDSNLTNPSEVDEASMAAGIVLVRWFAGEAERVYASLAASDDGREQSRLAEWIEGKGGSVTARDLSKGPRAYRGKPKEAAEALEALARAGYGVWEDVSPPKKGGRPTKRFTLHVCGPGPETHAHAAKNEGIGAGASGDTSPDDDWGSV